MSTIRIALFRCDGCGVVAYPSRAEALADIGGGMKALTEPPRSWATLTGSTLIADHHLCYKYLARALNTGES